jgi:hypothetical protein
MIQVDTAKVYQKVFSVREKYNEKEFSPAVNFTLKMRIPDSLTGNDLATHIMSEIVIRQANKTRKAGYEKFKDFSKVVEVVLNAPGTRTVSEGMTMEKFAAMSRREKLDHMRVLAMKAGGLKSEEIEELFEDLDKEEEEQK